MLQLLQQECLWDCVIRIHYISGKDRETGVWKTLELNYPGNKQNASHLFILKCSWIVIL